MPFSDAFDPAALTASDLAALVELRHDLHRAPELSGQEAETARRIATELAETEPDRVLTGLGGQGVAAVYSGAAARRTLLLRCELDALPIRETSDLSYRSEIEGHGHLCGHDGHMAMMLGVARLLGRARPDGLRVVLLFQPAEETGAGAAAVLADPAFEQIRPDIAVSLHNMPGLALGRVLLASGPVNCASQGVKIVLRGRTAHASQPETGNSPAPVLAALLGDLARLGGGTLADGEDFRMVTITHATLGAQSFGVAPGEAEIWATLRTLGDTAMADLMAATEALAQSRAGSAGLEVSVSRHDVFPASVNDPGVCGAIQRALTAAGIPLDTTGLPLRWSEDFGRFSGVAASAMFFLGSGETCAPLHDPCYDFPDALIATGTAAFGAILSEIARTA